MKISEAFDRYCLEEITLKNGSPKTVRNYRSAANSLIASCTDIPVNFLTLEHLSNWRRRRDSLGHSSSTVSHDLSRLKQVLKFLKRRGIDALDRDFIELPKVHRGQPVYLTAKEVDSIINVIESKRDKAIFACMFDSGARVSELLGINRSDLKDNTALIIGKGSKEGTLNFSEWSMGYLEDYLDSRKDRLTPLFISGQCRRITVSRVEQLLHIYSDEAGITKNVTPHTLRHSFASDLKLNGADIYDIKEQLRHERISSTEIYVHIAEGGRKKTYDQFHTNLARKPGNKDQIREELHRVDEPQ